MNKDKCFNVIEQDERIMIQLLRGIAIILVVFHHVLRTYTLSADLKNLLHFVNAVHVVVFFVISGWLFEKYKDKYIKQGFLKFFTNKFRQLIIPYFIFSFTFAMLIWCGNHIGALHKITSKITDGKEKSILKIFTDIILYKDAYFDSLWFLYVLFILMILMYLLAGKFFSSAHFTLITLLITILIKAYIGFVFDLTSYSIPDKLITYFVWVIIGRFLFTKFGYGFGLSKKLMIAAFVVLCTCILRTYFVDLHGFMNIYVRAFWIQIEFLLIRTSFLILSVSLSKILIECKKYKVLKYIGDRSYDIYLLHNPWFVSLISFGLKSFLPMFIVVAIGVVGSIAGSLIVATLIDRFLNPLYCILFGKHMKNA